MPMWMTAQFLKDAAIVIVSSAIAIGLYVKGRHDVQIKFDAYKLEVEAAGNAQEEKVKQITKTQDLVNKGSVDVYKANSAAVSNYYRGVRDNSGSCNLPTIPNGPIGADGKTDYAVFIGQCAQTTLQLKSLQDWVTTQQSVMK